MIPDENSFCELEQSPSQSELQRNRTLQELGLLEAGSVPIFEEATQTAAHFLNSPICVLSLLDGDRVWFKSAVGLSRIGLMNSLASSRQLARQDAFCARVGEEQRVLTIADAIADPMFSKMLLVQRYGIRSYLGVPLLAANGHCIGTLAVMGLAPRTFSDQEIAFLELIARWSMSEFERNRLQRLQHLPTAASAREMPGTSSVKANLLSQMAQELCTPLTSILGMAKVLSQGIYGSLSEKQQEYIQIIHNSGQYLLTLVNELVELGALDDQSTNLTLSPIDVEMLCQQAIGALNQAAQRREQKIQLTVEPGNRIWILDKDKVRQMLYHLVFSVIQASSADSIIRIHVSRKHSALHLSVWSSHPWLGDGLPQVALTAHQPGDQRFSHWTATDNAAETSKKLDWTSPSSWDQAGWDSPQPNSPSQATTSESANSRQNLGLMLSRKLAQLHAGDIIIQGSAAEGYRYVIRLPQMKAGTEPMVNQRP
jgi:signal transduction histidine kinase